METFNKKEHWDNIYTHKKLTEVSWYQEKPETSLNLIKALNIPFSASIIDIGGGDSFLLDNLIALGYRDITILDISEKAIERAKTRLGNKANNVKWIVADVLDFEPSKKYDLWHDRAAFHFLTNANDIEAYKKLVAQSLFLDAKMIIGTFSQSGPLKCSGIPITQYSKTSLEELFKQDFNLINRQELGHPTHFDTVLDFVFCSFEKN